jgi:hypothetical protein
MRWLVLVERGPEAARESRPSREFLARQRSEWPRHGNLPKITLKEMLCQRLRELIFWEGRFGAPS